MIHTVRLVNPKFLFALREEENRLEFLQMKVSILKRFIALIKEVKITLVFQAKV